MYDRDDLGKGRPVLGDMKKALGNFGTIFIYLIDFRLSSIPFFLLQVPYGFLAMFAFFFFFFSLLFSLIFYSKIVIPSAERPRLREKNFLRAY